MKSLLTVKLGRDLRATWSRLAQMVLALAISLTVFGGVLFAWGASGRETADAYAGTEPASATIVLDEGISVEEMTAIAAEARTRPGVVEATGRTQFDTDIEINGEAADYPLQVFVAAPDDPRRIANFTIDNSAWPPAADELLIGQDSLSLLGVAVGNTVTVQPPGGGPVPMRVADTVYDPSLSPSLQEQKGHGYLSTEALAASGTPATFDQLKIQVAEPGQDEPSRDRDAIVAVAGDVGTWLQEDYGLTIREIQVPEPYAHPHQWQSDTTLVSLLVGGAAALLLATILVANMLNTMFTQQIPQIGIMKAIGARSARIGRQYLAMTLIVATVATLLALVPAVLIGRAGTDMLLGMLGIDAISLAPPWWTYLVMVALGLALPPVMALIPLVKTSRTTVRAAIDHHGGGSKPSAATGVLARLSRLRRLDRGLLMALRNTVRRPARFTLSVGLLASAAVVFVTGMSLSTGVEAINDERTAQRNWDVDVSLSSPAAVDQVTALVEDIPGVSRVEAWTRAQTGVAGPGEIPLTRTYPDQGHGGVSITAFPDDTTMLPQPKLLEGRWLKPGETGAVVLNQIIGKNTLPGVQAGDTVQLFVRGEPTTWLVVGIVEEREGNGGIYTTADGYTAAMGQQTPRVNQLRIATDSHDEQTRTAVAAAVDQTLTSAGIEVGSAASVKRSEESGEAHLGPLVTIILVIAIAMGVIGGIGLASTMGANILDRIREFGIMHAVGARPKSVRRIVVAEGVFLAVASCLVAVIPTYALTKLLGARLGNLFMYAPIPYRLSTLAIGIWLALVILGAALATDTAATHASRITVREALTYL
jgi:putative ABC transport system permease protein